MRDARLLDTPIVGMMNSSYGDYEMIKYAEDRDSSYFMPTDKSAIDVFELIGMKNTDVSGIEDFWGFYLPKMLIDRVFTPYEKQTLTIADLDVYKSKEPSELMKAYRDGLQKFEDDLGNSLNAQYENPNATKEVQTEIKETIDDLKNELLLSFIFGDGADIVFTSMKQNRNKLSPNENATDAFNKVKKLFAEKFEVNFL